MPLEISFSSSRSWGFVGFKSHRATEVRAGSVPVLDLLPRQEGLVGLVADLRRDEAFDAAVHGSCGGETFEIERVRLRARERERRTRADGACDEVPIDRLR